ncbi:unnamed protein product [Paramecium pentaurelia]|uniref:ABC transmembrane type-1 domain-containing protein n=1 Tax=Paramecium pentaurelia TaxID=43138 RepID=A0A8S1WQY0_9CILI|nr:unnamed protein product [Paramecium pentaurelia]
MILQFFGTKNLNEIDLVFSKIYQFKELQINSQIDQNAIETKLQTHLNTKYQHFQMINRSNLMKNHNHYIERKKIMSLQYLPFKKKKRENSILTIMDKINYYFKTDLSRFNRIFIIFKKHLFHKKSQNNRKALTKIITFERSKRNCQMFQKSSIKQNKMKQNQLKRFSENNIFRLIKMDSLRISSKERSSMSKVIMSAQKDDAYLLAVLLVALNLFSFLTMYHGYNLAMIFSTIARMTLINLVYLKLTELSSSSIAEANRGKILNLVSGDINQIQKIKK